VSVLGVQSNGDWIIMNRAILDVGDILCYCYENFYKRVSIRLLRNANQ
jgi:hypothetical protein